MMISGVAFAAWFLTLGVRGIVSSAKLTADWSASGPSVTASQDAVCGITYNSTSKTMVLSMTKAFPGETCSYKAYVQPGSGNDVVGVISSIDLIGLSTGWTASLAGGSAGGTAELPTSGMAQVEWKVTAPATFDGTRRPTSSPRFGARSSRRSAS